MTKLYFSNRFSVTPGNKIATKPVVNDAPQIGAPIVQVSIATSPIKKKKKPIKELFLAFAKIIFSFILKIKQVNNKE